MKIWHRVVDAPTQTFIASFSSKEAENATQELETRLNSSDKKSEARHDFARRHQYGVKISDRKSQNGAVHRSKHYVSP